MVVAVAAVAVAAVVVAAVVVAAVAVVAVAAVAVMVAVVGALQPMPPRTRPGSWSHRTLRPAPIACAKCRVDLAASHRAPIPGPQLSRCQRRAAWACPGFA